MSLFIGSALSIGETAIKQIPQRVTPCHFCAHGGLFWTRIVVTKPTVIKGSQIDARFHSFENGVAVPIRASTGTDRACLGTKSCIVGEYRRRLPAKFSGILNCWLGRTYFSAWTEKPESGIFLSIYADKFHFAATSSDSGARTGTVTTSRGSFRTPVFMPVGTRGTIKAALATQIASIGYEVILGNTYHLMLRPGAEVVESFGSLHGFTGWPGHMLTDSGGFQVMSLGAKFSESGATFRSVYDGSTHTVSPERAVELQEMIGADIQMVLDVCSMLPASRDQIKTAMDLTHRWALRARQAKSRSDQAQFGIVQGGIELDYRAESAKCVVDMDFEGYAIGGLAVGEGRAEMLRAIDATIEHLPQTRVRYLMGVGDPIGVLEAISRGVDMFDCVTPSRIARHGTAMTFAGKLHLKNLAYQRDQGPIEKGCPCEACLNYPRGLIRHLVTVGEPTGGSLLTLHNLTFMHRLIDAARVAIRDGSLAKLVSSIRDSWGS